MREMKNRDRLERRDSTQGQESWSSAMSKERQEKRNGNTAVKFLALLLALFLVAGTFTACGDADNGAGQNDGGEPSSSADGTSGDAVNGEVPEAVTAMSPLIQAHATALVDGMTFDSEDPAYYWWAIKYAVDLCGENHPLAEKMEGGVKLPRQAVQEFAAALFADYSDLLPIPEDMAELIQYDADYDAYIFALGGGGYGLELGKYSMENGDPTLEVSLVSGADGSVSGTWKAIMVHNPYLDGIESPMFGYSIAEMQAL